ncbi:NAD-dependent epimerase/dehydratase family protein [Agrobacterium tumefaciens]|uniref:NAD-dependent epimerase/dehydratase family protein n=1 Tax=Agrobacterium tumefaciens TaxID=358 RepID=UPI0015745366|nr:NAD(P)-dependent oxidoreductase [Agrobacterium tumefaciens]
MLSSASSSTSPQPARSVLLTGAAGNVGRLLRPILARNFALKVTDIVDFDTTEGESKIVGDLASPDFCKQAVSEVDAVIHLAGLVGPAFAFEETIDPNYRAVLNLLQASHSKGIGRFIFASSHHAVGLYSSSGRYDERVPPAPDGYYGLSKVFGEAACSMYARRYGMRTMLLRIGNADAKVADGRRERLWTSARDMAQLIEIGLRHPQVECDIVYAVSNCPNSIFDNRRAEELGYRPVDFAGENRAVDFKSLNELPADAVKKVGGFFAISELPAPSGRKT